MFIFDVHSNVYWPWSLLYFLVRTRCGISGFYRSVSHVSRSGGDELSIVWSLPQHQELWWRCPTFATGGQASKVAKWGEVEFLKHFFIIKARGRESNIKIFTDQFRRGANSSGYGVGTKGIRTMYARLKTSANNWDRFWDQNFQHRSLWETPNDKRTGLPIRGRRSTYRAYVRSNSSLFCLNLEVSIVQISTVSNICGLKKETEEKKKSHFCRNTSGLLLPLPTPLQLPSLLSLFYFRE